MKDKPSEWVSISDLMAGVMAVVMLLLVVSVMQKSFADVKHKEELKKSAQEKKNTVTEILTDLKKSVSENGDNKLVFVDVSAGKITLLDSAFERGSACITSHAENSSGMFQQKISDFLHKVKDSRIYIEGHTDNLQVMKPVTDFVRFCTVYDDNFTLSAARAREIRKQLIAGLEPQISRRVLVAGYGDSQPLPDISPSDARNRRVEIRFFVSDQNKNNS